MIIFSSLRKQWSDPLQTHSRTAVLVPRRQKARTLSRVVYSSARTKQIYKFRGLKSIDQPTDYITNWHSNKLLSTTRLDDQRTLSTNG